jgi:ATP-dependent helicase/nuclease subunit A
MSSLAAQAPPDQDARNAALDPNRCVLVQAPAGSGKTDLLTRRFLRLLGEVDDPGEIVAITFTIAAAAEMRQRILSELEKAERDSSSQPPANPLSMQALANRALQRSSRMNWQLIDLPSRLRVTTIDAFCRELALQQPLLSGVGGSLEINEQPFELYRRAARLTLEKLDDTGNAELSTAIEALLGWRDNNWREMEDLLVDMLEQRDRWMQDFVLKGERDWEDLRIRLERPLANSVRSALLSLSELLAQSPGACDEVLELARFVSARGHSDRVQALAEIAELPCGPFPTVQALESAHEVYICLAQFVLTHDGALRTQVDSRNGFPPDCISEKLRMQALLSEFRKVPGLADALDHVQRIPAARYTEDEWRIVRSCFTVLRHASAELKTVFAETGTVDFTEVVQIAQQVLNGEGGLLADATAAVVDNIRHLLVDEFQDTSRLQHRLLSALVSAWPDQAGRSVFVVGDPMQSIYSFRDAEVELFQRIRNSGLDIADGEFLLFAPVDLTANFRTAPELVDHLNHFFAQISDGDDGSGISFSRAEAARLPGIESVPRLQVHLDFVPHKAQNVSASPAAAQTGHEWAAMNESARKSQLADIVSLIRPHTAKIEAASKTGGKHRIAILGRTRNALTPIAEALREANIPFSAVDLENLKDRPEVLDALALGRALMNPQDRVSWLSVLRAPWSGLSLEELHKLAGTDEWSFPPVAVPQLIRDKVHLMSPEARSAAERALTTVDIFRRLRATQPTIALGTLLQQAWTAIGGEYSVDATARANLSLLWSLLDKLPQGERDFCGAALDAALSKLCAVSDPEASYDYGVQLMTIHKSKGLEFEVVIIPDLHAATRQSKKSLLAWMERGVANHGEAGEVTEFLVAPMQPKGADRGKAKKWVDDIRLEKEKQETRRILYVAATRAREELHLFARPSYRGKKGHSQILVEPSKSLLATAWPALKQQVTEQFEEWKEKAPSLPAEDTTVITALAASEETNVILMPRPQVPTILRRLPANIQIAPAIGSPAVHGTAIVGDSSSPYERHEGGLRSRALGNAVHKFLEEFAQMRKTRDLNSAVSALPAYQSAIIAQIRGIGMPSSQAASIAAQALDVALAAANDLFGRWILSPHPEAATEAGWAGIVDGAFRHIRVDRVFRAGPQPLADGDDAWWVIDYKTAHVDNVDPAFFLPMLRATFAPQLERYSAVLRNLHGGSAKLRAGIYYPRMLLLDWWEI